MATDTREPWYGNGWWLLALIAGAITFLVGLLEAFGVWHELGVGLGFMGLILTMFFGANGATQRAVMQLDRRMDQINDTLLHIIRILDARLPDQRTR